MFSTAMASSKWSSPEAKWSRTNVRTKHLYYLFGFARKKQKTKGSKGRILGAKASLSIQIWKFSLAASASSTTKPLSEPSCSTKLLYGRIFSQHTKFCKRMKSFSWLRRDLRRTITRFSHLSTLLSAYMMSHLGWPPKGVVKHSLVTPKCIWPPKVFQQF